MICCVFTCVDICLCTGLTIGGVWGLAEGLRRPEGKTLRLRLNSVLNGCTRRGPFLANTAAVLGMGMWHTQIYFMTNTTNAETSIMSVALMYSPLESTIAHYRGKEDNFNSIAAATITGLLYKSTGEWLITNLNYILHLTSSAGVRPMGLAGIMGCSVIGVYIATTHLLGRETLLFSWSHYFLCNNISLAVALYWW